MGLSSANGPLESRVMHQMSWNHIKQLQLKGRAHSGLSGVSLLDQLPPAWWSH